MGAVNTTYTFTATDTITSAKMNNIIDQTTVTDEAIIGTTLEVASGKLKVRSQGITSNEMAANSVTSTNIVDGTIVNADISPTAAIAGTKISPAFGAQNITATGDIGLEGTASDYTVVSLTNTSGVQVHLNANGNSEGNLRTTTNHPLTLHTNNTERMRISASGNVGINNSNPQTKLHIYGSGETFRTDDGVRAIIAGCDANEPFLGTATNHPLRVITNNTERMRITAAGDIGIGKTPTTKLDVNGTVTATAFAGPLTGNVTGTATTATTATTVSNGAITAEKLNGSQSGSAPIFGARAWVNFNGNPATPTITGQGNVSSVSKSGTGNYTVNLTTALSDTTYAIVGFARDAGTTPGNYFVSAVSNGTKTTSSFQIRVHSTGGLVDSPEINIMVIR